MTSHYTWDEGTWPHYMMLGGCVGTAFGHFLLGSHDLMVMALGSCVKWPLLLHTARLLQLLNVEHQTGALIDQSMSPIGSQNYGSWTLCKVLAYPHPTAGEVYFRWVAGIRERLAGINHPSGKLDIFVYLYPSSLWVYNLVVACFGMVMFHSTYHLEGGGGGWKQWLLCRVCGLLIVCLELVCLDRFKMNKLQTYRGHMFTPSPPLVGVGKLNSFYFCDPT
jgi:hypothetical protein